MLSEGEDVPASPGTVGRLAVDIAASPLMTFRGYQHGSDSSGRFAGDGRWYLTGDSAHQDEDGDVFFSSRDDDVIVMAGWVGTAALQVARALGARTIAVVSSAEKERVARQAGAEHVFRADAAWLEQARELTDGRGVDVVLDPVGGERFADSLRSLGLDGRVVAVGFTEGSIPQAKVNRLLLTNTEVVGAAWTEYMRERPSVAGEIGEAVNRMVEDGFVRPIVGARLPLAQGADALRLVDGRGALGKIVLDVHEA